MWKVRKLYYRLKNATFSRGRYFQFSSSTCEYCGEEHELVANTANGLVIRDLGQQDSSLGFEFLRSQGKRRSSRIQLQLLHISTACHTVGSLQRLRHYMHAFCAVSKISIAPSLRGIEAVMSLGSSSQSRGVSFSFRALFGCFSEEEEGKGSFLFNAFFGGISRDWGWEFQGFCVCL